MSPVYLLLSVALVAVMCPQPGVSGPLEATISADPAGAVMIRKNVKLTCTASGGTESYTLYTWTRDGKIVDRQMNKDYQLTAENEGSVTVSCSVTDSAPITAISANFKVPFYEKEIQAKISADKPGDVKINTNVTLTCGASGGVPPYKPYSWTRDGEIVAGHTKKTYELNETRKGEVEVTCKVTDDVDNTKTSDKLIVTFSENKIQAKIFADKTCDVAVNTNVTFICKASGGTEVYKPYIWTKNKVIVAGHTKETYELAEKKKGQVKVACKVTDDAGNTTTSGDYIVTFSGAIKPTVSLAWSFSLGLILWAVLPSSRVELSV